MQATGSSVSSAAMLLDGLTSAERRAWERLRVAQREVAEAERELVLVTNRRAARARLQVIEGGMVRACVPPGPETLETLRGA